MKLLVGDGKELTVRDVGPVLVALRTRRGGPPIKFNGYRIVEDEAARELLRGFIATGHYEREAV